MSAATKLTPSSPRMIVRSSRVVQPPVSGVPVAGATVGICQFGGEVKVGGEGRGGRGRTCWVQGVDVDAQIHWFLRADSISDLLDDPTRPDRIDFPRLHNLEPAVSIIVVVAQPAQRRADPRVYVRIVRQQSLSVRVVEICAVVYRGLKRRGSAEDFGLPGVEVRVEMYDADGTVGFVDGAQERERDGVVAAEGYDAGQGLFVLCRADLFCICGRCAHEEAVVTFFDLLDCIGIVVAGDKSVFGSSSLVVWEVETHDVTGISPQSITVAQLLKGLASRGTL